MIKVFFIIISAILVSFLVNKSGFVSALWCYNRMRAAPPEFGPNFIFLPLSNEFSVSISESVQLFTPFIPTIWMDLCPLVMHLAILYRLSINKWTVFLGQPQWQMQICDSRNKTSRDLFLFKEITFVQVLSYYWIWLKRILSLCVSWLLKCCCGSTKHFLTHNTEGEAVIVFVPVCASLSVISKTSLYRV